MEMPAPKLNTSDIYEDILAFLSLIIIWTAFVYYIYALNLSGLLLALSAASLCFWAWKRWQPQSELSWHNRLKAAWPPNTDKRDRWLLAGYLILAASQITLALTSRSGQALISPWEKLPSIFFGLYGVGVVFLARLFGSQTLARSYKTALLSLHYLISFGLAAAVYQVGYGFDPFVHEAAMKYIADQGAILPKTPYYLGQYGLMVALHKLTAWPLSFINVWLLPVLSAFLLPPSLVRYYPRILSNQVMYLSALFLPVLTFAPLIVTTPQNLSYLFLGLAVISGQKQEKIALTTGLSLAAAAIHPLTGLPALAWCTFLWLQRYRTHLAKTWFWSLAIAIFITAIGGLPLALMLAGGARVVASASQYWSNITALLPLPTLAGQEDIILNLTYLITANFSYLLFLAGLGAIIYSWKNGFRPLANLALLAALSLAYLISRGLEFRALIDYEQADYAQRIPVIMLIFSLPFFLNALAGLLDSIQARPRFERLAWLVAGTGLAVTSLYASYPRFDHYWNSRGYSTGKTDLAAVQLIEQDAPGPYIVLANQQVGAAALREIGFDHYRSSRSGPVYAYAIPTGGPLYRFYLDMVYQKPERSTMEAAADFSQVKTAYLAVNKYWNKSGQIINAAKVSADKWWSVSDEVFIFRYDF